MRLHIDFETCSKLELPKVGAYRYTAHKTTWPHCMAWAIDDEEPEIWIPTDVMPDKLKDAIGHSDVHAWNAQFERLVFQNIIGTGAFPPCPMPTFNQWKCTAAQARANALPGKLANCAKLLGIEEQKQDARLMKRLADGNHHPSDEELRGLFDYCKQDVRVERQIFHAIQPLSEDEEYMFQVNEHINDNGIGIDVEFCKNMLDYLDYAKHKLNERIAEITEGEITTFNQIARMKKFLGLRTDTSLDARAIEELIDMPMFDAAQREVLSIRQQGGKASTAKYSAMANQTSPDGRLRGMFKYAGAGQTGRFSGVGPQLHNLTRKVDANAAEKIEAIKMYSPEQYSMVYGSNIIEQASALIRPALLAEPGMTFVIGDYSAVEAKGVPWLAGEQEEIDAWASGVDRYIEDAMNVFNLPLEEVGDSERQAGKVVRLACGFGGKGGALLQMAKGYGIELGAEEAHDMANAWHAANPWVQRFGKALEKAALTAMHNPGMVFEVGEHIKYASEIIDGVQWLRCMLPSGRVISYYDARLEESQFGGYQISSIKPRSGTRERLWHGLFSENVTQATCNDLMRHAMVLLYVEGYSIVAHVHDETVEEVMKHSAEEHCVNVKRIMEKRPDWAEDFPLVAKVHSSDRYTK